MKTKFREFIFAFETTLATKTYKPKILKAQQNGYIVSLLFFWLNNAELPIDRVKTRVMEGGHNIPEDVSRRRYTNGIKNLFEIYLPIVDEVSIFDNSKGETKIIAIKTLNNLIKIEEVQIFERLQNYNNERK